MIINIPKLKRYRIETDQYSGYQVTIWRIWFPFWIQARCSNTHSTVEKAEEYIARGCRYKSTFKIIKEL